MAKKESNLLRADGVLRMNPEDVVRTYADMVYKIAYRYTSNPHDAEDVFSEVFLSYFKKDRTFESEDHRKAWLIRVTINCAKDVLSARGSAEEINEEIVAAPTGLPQEELMSLRDAIARLPSRQREVITLFYLQELPIKTIAEMLGINEGTVKSALFHARERLRVYLEDERV